MIHEGWSKVLDPMKESSQAEMLSAVSGIMAPGCESWSISSYNVTLRDAGLRLSTDINQGNVETGQGPRSLVTSLDLCLPGLEPPTPPTM